MTALRFLARLAGYAVILLACGFLVAAVLIAMPGGLLIDWSRS